jgi:hypothetical protein
MSDEDFVRRRPDPDPNSDDVEEMLEIDEDR